MSVGETRIILTQPLLGWVGTGTRKVRWTPVRGGQAVTYPESGANAQSAPDPDCNEMITVTVGQKYSPPFSGRTPPRRDRQWIRTGRNHHDIALTDPRTQRRFWLNHDARFVPALFRLTDPVIAGSFRLLPPSTLIPSGM